jgi:hypothetical protein
VETAARLHGDERGRCRSRGVENAILQSALQPAGMISGFPLDIRRRASGALLAFHSRLGEFRIAVWAGHGEEGQPCAVEYEHRTTQPVDDGMPVEGDRAREEGDRQVSPIADCRRRNRSDQQVAGDAAGIGRCKGKDQNAEEIKSALHPRRRAAQREDERADKIVSGRPLAAVAQVPGIRKSTSRPSASMSLMRSWTFSSWTPRQRAKRGDGSMSW